MSILGNIFTIFGGLALFLYAMILMSSGLQKVAGDKLKQILENITKSKIRAIATGTFITAIVQSSSIVAVTALAFINAGLLNLQQAAGVIMGANIGTTITAQLVAFKIGILCFPLIILGFFISVLSKKRELKYLGETILGFGLLFLGMELMSQGFHIIRDNQVFLNLLSRLGKIPVLGVLAGAFFTATIQSSSATSGLVIAMGREGIINLKTAISLILGANIGTCITASIASLGATKNAKRAALFHVLFNTIGVLYFLPLIGPFSQLMAHTSHDVARQIANAHTFFNVFNTLIFIFISGIIIALIKKIIPSEEHIIERGTKYLDKKLLGIPTIALAGAHKEVVRMMKATLSMLESAEKVIFASNKSSTQIVLQLNPASKSKMAERFPAIYKTDILNSIYQQEDAVDEMNWQIEKYLRIISEKELNQEDSQKLAGLTHAITDIERIGDHANNLAEHAQALLEKNLSFSQEASFELLRMFDAVILMLKHGIEALKNYNQEISQLVLKEEPVIDSFQKELQEHHLERLEKGICHPEAGIIFVDMLRNLERIGDHLDNITHMVLTGF